MIDGTSALIIVVLEIHLISDQLLSIDKVGTMNYHL
jgi:hypothetical protein